MNGVNSYAAYQDNYYNSVVKNKNSDTKTAAGKKTSGTQNTVNQPKLSDKAQDLLERLKKTYGSMDFMVAGKGDDAKEILSRGTKEFSVLFSAEELEKMASDEKYEKQYMDKVQGAVRMSEQISKQFGFGPASEKGNITKIGIAFHSDGSTSYFAGLEKMSENQRERIEKAKEQKKDLKDIPIRSKRIQVSASSMDELIKKMNQVDWSKIREEDHTNHGYGLDYSI